MVELSIESRNGHVLKEGDLPGNDPLEEDNRPKPISPGFKLSLALQPPPENMVGVDLGGLTTF